MEKKKTTWKCLLKGTFALVMAVMLMLSGVQGLETKAAAKPKLSQKSMLMYTKQSKKLKVSHTRSKIKWSSSNKKIATVSSKGTVKAVRPGKCNIYAKVKGKKLKCKIEVVTKQQYYGRNLYTMVRKKGSKISADVRKITMKVKEKEADNYYTVSIYAYPKKWMMKFRFDASLEEPSEHSQINVALDVSKDQMGKLEYKFVDGYSDDTTYVEGWIEKSGNADRNGLNLTYCEYLTEEEEFCYRGEPREAEWQMTSASVKGAFSYYDKLLKKYGYSMKKIGFVNP